MLEYYAVVKSYLYEAFFSDMRMCSINNGGKSSLEFYTADKPV